MYSYKSLRASSGQSAHYRDESCDSDSLDGSLDASIEKGNEDCPSSRYRLRTTPSYWLWILQCILLTISTTMFILTSTSRPSTPSCVKQHSAWSPAASAVAYERVTYNITTKNNRFVGASPEVDKAWREISYDPGDQWIPKSALTTLGMPQSSLQVSHPTTGEPGYRVGIEVFHHLHCLNLLRRVTYKDYYEPRGGEFAGGPEKLRRHTDHCIEVLRLNLQCTPDVGRCTFYMLEGDPLPWPQLNSKHVCRNFDAVREWAVENSVGNMEFIE